MFKLSKSALYGSGVFTTVAIVIREPFLFEKHWRRIVANAEKSRIDISEYTERSVADALAELIEKNEITNGRARITFSDESPSEIWGGEAERKTNLSIITAPRRKMPEHYKLTFSPRRVNTTSPLAGIKSCNYLEPLMAFDEAKARGFDEAIRLNERGEVASACMANVFWLKDGKLHTPSLKTGCLAGTTREFILESIECVEVEATLTELNSADDILLTSAGIGVVQVAGFEGRAMARQPHKILDIVPKPI